MNVIGVVRTAARGCLVHVILNPIVMLALSFTLVLGGIILVVVIREDDQSARAIEAAPTLGTSSVGKTAIVEARIGASNPARDGTLVAFVREAYRSCFESSTPCWIELERATPPLALDETEREVRIVNDDYQFGSTAQTVELAKPTLTDGTHRARGFEVGDTVLVIGTARTADEIEATTVYAGTKEEALDYLRRGSLGATIIGSAAALGGLVWGGFGVWILRRHLREIRQEQAEEAQQREAAQANGRKRGKRKR